MTLTVLRSTGECGLMITPPVTCGWPHIMLSDVHSPLDIQTDLITTTSVQVDPVIIPFLQLRKLKQTGLGNLPKIT